MKNAVRVAPGRKFLAWRFFPLAPDPNQRPRTICSFVNLFSYVISYNYIIFLRVVFFYAFKILASSQLNVRKNSNLKFLFFSTLILRSLYRFCGKSKNLNLRSQSVPASLGSNPALHTHFSREPVTFHSPDGEQIISGPKFLN